MSDIEHDVKVIPIDANLQTTIKKLESEGWELIPGVVPVAIYHLARNKDQPPKSLGGEGSLGIDDTKVHVLRNGQIVN
jgi:hypothetical protein